MAKAFLIGGLEQAWTEVAVDFDGGTDNFVGEFVVGHEGRNLPQRTQRAQRKTSPRPDLPAARFRALAAPVTSLSVMKSGIYHREHRGHREEGQCMWISDVDYLIRGAEERHEGPDHRRRGKLRGADRRSIPQARLTADLWAPPVRASPAERKKRAAHSPRRRASSH